MSFQVFWQNRRAEAAIYLPFLRIDKGFFSLDLIHGE